MEPSTNTTITTRHRGLVGEHIVELRDTLHEVAQAKHAAERRIAKTRSLLARRLWRLRAQARQVGFAAGQRAGRAAVDAIIERITHYSEIVHSARKDCLDLSVAIAAEIMEADLVPNTALLAQRIERAMSDLLDRRTPRIRVAPAEVEMLRISLRVSPPTAIVPDSSLGAGDAIIETTAGQIRLVWREHLARMREQLVGQVSALPDVQKPGAS